MAGNPIAHFDPDPERFAVIRECTENYGVGDADAEWPNNILSRRAVAYGSGVITRQGEAVRHSVDPDELALCRRLAAEVEQLMAGVDVGMGSESSDPFRGFFIAANQDEPTLTAITPDLIRARFGGTIFPPATVVVEPLVEAGTWWEIVAAESGDEDAYLRPWQAMIRWFRERLEFVDTAFVQIGEATALWQVPEEQYPPDTEVAGCVLPRLALGLTRGGSLVGLFGYSVQT